MTMTNPAPLLTDVELDILEHRLMMTRSAFSEFSTNEIESLLAEVRRHRAAALTSDERRDLEWLATMTRLDCPVGNAGEPTGRYASALAILDRLSPGADRG